MPKFTRVELEAGLRIYNEARDYDRLMTIVCSTR